MTPHPFDDAPAAARGPVRSVLVFCGSRPGIDPAHAAAARGVGALLARRGVRLVYGGGALGLMGDVARAALAEGGEVVGVIPRFLMDLEVAQPGLSETVVVDTLHERKREMLARADAVLALPGGLGTLDELAEVMSWRNLRLTHHPVWLLGGWWEPFTALLAHMERSGFNSPAATGFAELLDLAALDARLAAA